MFSFQVNDDIRVELLQQEDKEELYRLIDDNRDHLREWLPWVDKRQSPRDLEPVIPTWIRNYADNNGFDAGIRFQGRLVGMIGLHYIDWKNRETSIGYFLAKNAEGNGIISQCIRALCHYLFLRKGLNRIVIQCDATNVKSQRVPERLGFVREGVARQAHWLHDHYEDLVTYSLLREDWNR